MDKYPNTIPFADASKEANPCELFLVGRAKPLACHFTQERVDPFTVPAGSYVYELRCDANGNLCALESEPIEDCFGGTVITNEQVYFGGKPCIPFNDSGNSFEFV